MKSSCQASQCKPFCKIRGRMITPRNFRKKLENFCDFNGMVFTEKMIWEIAAKKDLKEQLRSVISHSNSSSDKPRDTILLLKATLPYEQSWGGFGSLPKSVLNMPRVSNEGDTTSCFIQPYLDQYKMACRSVKLGRDSSNNCTLIIPDYLLAGNSLAKTLSLSVVVDDLVVKDASGKLLPESVNGSNQVFTLTDKGVEKIAATGFEWIENHVAPIGHHLSAEFLHFDSVDIKAENKLYAEILIPEMSLIVTDHTPQLRAAEIFLLHRFSSLSSTLHDIGSELAGKVFCIAGLQIDMTSMGEDPAGYFIPWKAYFCSAGQDQTEGALEQDDLFAELMGQNSTDMAEPGVQGGGT